ncbi:thiol:disulfide interchange protein DsbA/DsbL [Marinospirillum alkaliphilum]|uniref:Thiol:disulfide interchange protein n=1 Tax=Marinospirillum alkaliphilum DSM 21637 TaxID=1122209 RepID=A0A1K1Y4A9_9GAMM|nr:thiol:disulfide interchange protein DsbA/DsbL [Marinospirillum alkaliphilum]SFX56727.1 thiol:disulfide interchange protein DsbA [Marinospirillum alkaliphilum DSM 21637]
MTRLFRTLLLVLLLTSTTLLAQSYRTLNERVPTQVASGKIEVTSIFSYTCPFCYQLEPQLEAWAAKLPADVEVVHLPAAFNSQWEHLARGYYIMDALDITEQAHMALFDEIHQKQNNLGSVRAMAQFFERYGVKAEDTERLYRSFGVESRLRQDTARLRGYRVTGVPALVIDGRYVIDGQSAGSLPNMLKVADQVIEQVRASR